MIFERFPIKEKGVNEEIDCHLHSLKTNDMKESLDSGDLFEPMEGKTSRVW